MLVSILGVFIGMNVSGYSLEDLIGREQANTLLSGEKPVLAQFKDPRPQLAPRYEALNGLIEKIRADLEPNVMVETLHIYKKPPEAGRSLSNTEMTALFNGITALSTLRGLQYFSASRGRMRTLYETSSVIDEPSTKKPLPDPVYSSPPADLSLYARQKDLSFGDNIYQYSYFTAPEAMIFTQQNLTTLTLGIIPAVSKNKLHSIVAILDTEDYLLVYAVSMAKAASFPGMKERIGTSFANRAEAIIHWFSDQADKAFASAD